MVVGAGVFQLLLATACLGQISQDSPILHVVSPARPAQIVCYAYRSGYISGGSLPKEFSFSPEDIDPFLCTHVIFGYVTSFEEKALPQQDLQKLQGTVALKNSNPNLKVLCSLYIEVFNTSSFTLMNNFVNQANTFLKRHKFDGLDIAWTSRDTEEGPKFLDLLKELRKVFERDAKISGKPRLLLTAKVDGLTDSVPGKYNVPEISKYLEFFNLETYYFKVFSGKVWHNSPLYAQKSADAFKKRFNVHHSSQLWIKSGAPKEKLMIGMPTFGAMFTLSDPTKTNIGAAYVVPGDRRVYPHEATMVAYVELCPFLLNKNWSYIWDEEQEVPHTYRGEQWVGFDDVRSLKNKMAWLKREGFGGVSIWNLSGDDHHGNCGTGKFPLINAIKQELASYKVKLEYRGPYESSYYIDKNREATDLSKAIASISTAKNKVYSKCSKEQFKCKNGQCIDRKDRCDGKIDCNDSSDETYTQCKNAKCPNKHFRCKYGGCVDIRKRCDRIEDCADASDEDAIYCANKESPEGCVAPLTFPGTEYISGFCALSDAESKCIARPGSIMAYGSYLNVRCNKGYAHLPGASKFLTCSKNEIYMPYPPPTCKKTCTPLEINPNVQAECRFTAYAEEGHPYYKVIPCNRPLVEKTTVTLSCPLHFKQRKQVLTCLETGQWDQELTSPFECEPACGVKREQLSNKIDGGSKANAEDYPWHAGLYRYGIEDEKEEYKYICGGSLISQNVVLTAAHCGFLDGVIYSSTFVALGKRKIHWESEDGNTTQRFQVKSFIVQSQYIGQDQSFSNDIALIILDRPVEFNFYVRPVCLNNLPSRFHDEEAIGQVPGWGATATAPSSEDLHFAEIPFVPTDQCKNLLKKDSNLKLLTFDKFCGGSLGSQGAKAGQGDSGGGLVYRDDTSGLYYVVGVVSATIPRENFRISAYTNVSIHYDWIRQKMRNNIPL